MKNFLAILFFLLSLATFAQKLSVEAFKENTNDLSARTSSRADNNGTPCALVKVQLAASGAQFAGSIVGNVQYNTSEYLVYMPLGSKRLTVKLEGYLPLNVQFSDYGIANLASKTTYVMTITGVVSSTVQQQEVRTKTGWIILDSKPQGAAVYINNVFVGNTPLDSYKQPYGKYNYRLDMPNYHSAEGIVELNSAQFERTVTLKPAFGSISVSGNVAGANVLLDGKSTGKTTPCTLTEIPSGSHVIALQKEKYAPMQYNVIVKDGMEAKVNGNLDARFASVTIKTMQGADILIDNSRKGATSHTLDLMEGYYDVEVRLAHHKPATKQIQVVAGQTQTVTLNPTPIYGSLDVVSTPRNATITIDGKEVGHTPFTVEQLLEGNHTVKLSMAGYSTVSKQVTISDGQTATLSSTLQNGREITITCAGADSHIYVDGQDMGLSPFKGSLTYGQHTTYAMLNGKKSSEQTISVSEGNGALPSVVLFFFGPRTFTVKGITFNMIRVDGGTFTMGGSNSNEKPTHRVTLSSYYIGETEVTQQLWEKVMGSNPAEFKGSTQPVESVSWDDCQKFIKRLNSLTGLNFRLPTEAEWEFAARGGNKSKGYEYSGSNNPNEVAWHSMDIDDESHPVATKSPNELGVYDMSGNVWEWCQDRFGSYSRNKQTNPTGPSNGSFRVFRGGSWYNEASECHVSVRARSLPFQRGYNHGLRLALSE